MTDLKANMDLTRPGRAGPELIRTNAVPRVDAVALLAGGKEVILVYKDSEYRLHLTRKDKLILTK